MKWHELDIVKLIEVVPGKDRQEKINNAFDIKYGDFDYIDDLRSLTNKSIEKKIAKSIESLKRQRNKLNVLIAGANSGIEVPYFSGTQITAIDVSKKALNHLSEKYPFVTTQVMNMNKLEFEENSFDMYCSLRVIQSYGVDLEMAINESIRVTKDNGICIFSIPNGYIVNGKVRKGMYDPSRNEYNTSLPTELISKISELLLNKGMKSHILDTESEILLVVTVRK